MSKSIDHDKMYLRFNEKRGENTLIRLNQRKIEIILVEFFMRHSEKKLKYNS